MARSRWFVVACLLLQVAVGVGYLAAVPAWEAPDEPWHVVYAAALAAGHLPQPADTYEWYQPPGYYGLLALNMRLLGLDEPAPWQVNPRFPFAAAALAHPAGDPAEAPVRLLRALSGLLGTLVVALTWATARRVWPAAPEVAGAAALWVALWPQFQFISHSITNDTLAAVAGAMGIYGLVRLVLGRDRPWPGALAMVVGLILAVYAKLNALAVLPAVSVVAVAIWRRGPGRRSPALWALGLALLAPAAAALVLTLAWPSVGTGMVAAAGDRAMGTGARLDAAALLRLVVEMSVTFVARFGWLNVPLPKLVTGLLVLCLAATGFGLLRLRGRSPDLRWGMAVLAVAVASLAAAAVKNLLADPQPQGRFLFPALSAVAILVSAGWRLLLGERRWAPVVAGAGLGLLALNGWIVAVVLPRAYPANGQTASTVLWRAMGNAPDAHRRLPLRGDEAVQQSFIVDTGAPFQVAVPVAAADPAASVTMRVTDAGGRNLAVLTRAGFRAGDWLSLTVDPKGKPPAPPLRLELVKAGPRLFDVWATDTDVAPDGQLKVVGSPRPFDLVLLVTAPPDAAPTGH